MSLRTSVIEGTDVARSSGFFSSVFVAFKLLACSDSASDNFLDGVLLPFGVNEGIGGGGGGGGRKCPFACGNGGGIGGAQNIGGGGGGGGTGVFGREP